MAAQIPMGLSPDSVKPRTSWTSVPLPTFWSSRFRVNATRSIKKKTEVESPRFVSGHYFFQ